MVTVEKSVEVHGKSFVPYISKEQIEAKIKVLGKALCEKYHDKFPLFIGVLNGSYVFAADLVRAFPFPCEVSFVKFASYTGLKSSGEVSSILGLNASLEGRHVIVVEDIVDSGNTLYAFMKEVRLQNPASAVIASLLFKPDAIERDLKIDFVGFEIPNKFVIGYGLDFDGLGRNLEGVYQLAGE